MLSCRLDINDLTFSSPISDDILNSELEGYVCDKATSVLYAGCMCVL